MIVIVIVFVIVIEAFVVTVIFMIHKMAIIDRSWGWGYICDHATVITYNAIAVTVTVAITAAVAVVSQRKPGFCPITQMRWHESL
jgi:hypothetical protein